MSRLAQYAKNVGVLIGQSIVQRAFGMITTVLLARTLGATGLGVYAAVISTANTAYGLVRLGADAAIHVQTATQHADEAARCSKGEMLAAGFLLLFLGGLFGSVACLFSANWLATTVYGNAAIASPLLVAAPILLFHCVSQFAYVTLAGLHQFSPYARATSVSAAMAAVAIWMGGVYWGVFGALAATALVQGVTMWILLRLVGKALRKERIQLRMHSITRWIGLHLKFGLPFYFSGFVSIPLSYAMQGMLSQHSGLDALGQVRVIASIVTILSFVPNAASGAMISFLVRSASHSRESFINDAFQNAKFVWMFSVLAGVGIFSGLPIIISILFGASYADAVVPASVAILGGVVSGVMTSLGNALFANRKVVIILLQTILHSSCFAIAAVILIPKFGVVGYYSAELFGLIVSAIYMVGKACRGHPKLLKESSLRAAFFLSAFIGMGVIAFSFPELSAYRAVGGLGLFMITAWVSCRYVLSTAERVAVIGYVFRLAQRS